MANQKLTALAALAAITADDIFYVVNDPGGTPESKKIAYSTLLAAILAAAPTIQTKTIYTTGSGTFTPRAGTVYMLVEIVGGGGGGGGASSSAGQAAAGAGGGSGGYARKLYTSIAASYSYAVGAGGTAGANTGGTGGTGDPTTFGAMTANGGIGGAGHTTGTSLDATQCGNGGSASGGDFNETGGGGVHGIRLSGSVVASGTGAASFFGGGGVGRVTALGGQPGLAYGSGGGGGAGINGSPKTGGAGAGGVIIITEFGT